MNIKMSLFSAALGALALGFGAPASAAIQTDVIFIVDESGSMGTEQVNLRTNIGLFASILSGGGQVDAQYGLVGYGNSSVVPRMLTDLTTPENFATAALGLVASGGTEPAYTASAFALNALDGQTSLFSFRPNSIKNLIILTDEPSNGDTIARGAVGGLAVSFAVIDGLLTNNNVLYNAVLTGASTINSIGPLATGHGGAVFDLASLSTTDQTVVQAFVTDFANAKLQETLDFCVQNPNDPACVVRQGVSAPSSMALLGAGLLLTGLYRRRTLLN
ncbi:MAG: vWA domain-containing protein [Pseudomonadota bacterium]